MKQPNTNDYTTDISNNFSAIDSQYEIDKREKNDIPFWSENPNILLQSNYIFEFFPIDSMSYNQKLNAISRTVFILTLISFLFTRSFRILIVGTITLVAIYLLHYNNTLEKEKTNRGSLQYKENFANPALEILKEKGVNMDSTNIDTSTFDTPVSSNPFSNVLLPDYDYNPQKKPAPASFTQNNGNEILKQAKQLVVDANPGQPDIADKLFKDLGEEFVFEQSLQPFYSNAATTIPNDQAGFADFCYGSMISCKEGNLFACARNLDRYTN